MRRADQNSQISFQILIIPTNSLVKSLALAKVEAEISKAAVTNH